MNNDLILKAARGEKVDRTPVWLMRQAGRILPEYRALRKKVKSFKELVKTPELACEVTLQPVDILEVDAAIIFSDILVIPEAMGLPYEMKEQFGPYFEKTISTGSDIENLKVASAEDLSYVTEAIHLVKRALNGKAPLIGFAGAPWTVLSYMIEGQGSKTFSKARKFLYTEPELSHQLLEKITQSTINYLKAQIEAGADMLQLFDSWAGILSPDQYREYGIPYLEKICASIGNDTPIIVFAKGANFALKDLSELSCDVIGIDWNMEISDVKSQITDKTLQGNLDPALLYSDTAAVKDATTAMLNAFGPDRHIANLGHGVYPDTPLDSVKAFINTVKEHRFE